MTARAATPAFSRREGVLACENVSLEGIATRFGTPAYVYSRRAIESGLRAYTDALRGRPHQICYAMKANSNLAVLDLLARAGAGFDIVSGGELARVLAVGADPSRVVFSGVGKTEAEIEMALRAGIGCFNIESVDELDVVDRIAGGLQMRAPISVRVNPDVDPQTHPYISTGLKQTKFGVPFEVARDLYRAASRRPAIAVTGIDFHIGSQITQVGPYLDAAARLLDLVDQIEADGIALAHIDFGGGLGISYRDERPPGAGELVAAVLGLVDSRGHGRKTVMFEPGRSIVGHAGVLLARVTGVKCTEARNYVIVDAAMNDLIRPALYDAWMEVVAVRERPGTPLLADVVGPVCESGDWLARDRPLVAQPGDLLAVMSAGAYGMSMASNYNSRPRAVEILVDGDRVHEVRRRETFNDLFAAESTLP
ncbi:MAG TPA: diaminopimelate decarboxylase [Burkholderiaceae bacterium]|nr:diaminopimelate decarboxylase [Burkholderiaceae bacterium]